MSRYLSLAKLVFFAAVVLSVAGFSFRPALTAVSAPLVALTSDISVSPKSGWRARELPRDPSNVRPEVTNVDGPPTVLQTIPADGAADVDLQSTISVVFSEAVVLTEPWFEISCSQSGPHTGSTSGAGSVYYIDPSVDFLHEEDCQVTLFAGAVSDLDGEPQLLAADYIWQFTTVAPPESFVVINELDTETPGLDTAEFIELFDGGRGQTALDGMSLVLYDGQNDLAYASVDLAGMQTDAEGYFLVGNAAVAGADLIIDDALLQNGADAVALYRTVAGNIPPGTAVTTENLQDAVVYGPATAPDAGLLQLLLDGETQVDEDARSLADFHSLQRCPDGSGGQRRTVTFWPDIPTPGQATPCVLDDAPEITSTLPADGTRHVPLNGPIQVTFSEGVSVYSTWFDLTCDRSGNHSATFLDDTTQYTILPDEPFSFGEQCRVTIYGSQVSDLDALDPPDHPATDYSWSFSAVPATHLVINEIDADTDGVDTLEFIELYDGGAGNTPLDGLAIVLYNGAVDSTYGTFDLDGHLTDAQGRFVIGSAAVPGVALVLPDNTIQNGADAAALYAADGAEFPNGTGITLTNLVDAVVYGTGDETDIELLGMLAIGEQQVDEDGRRNAIGDSIQRCPDGAGEQLHTSTFIANLATPGKGNKCTFDAAPLVTGTTPADGESSVALDTAIGVSFSETVALQDGWVEFTCAATGSISVNVQHTGAQALLKATQELPASDSCTVVVRGFYVTDTDLDDPPDTMAVDVSWTFTTASMPVARQVIINEVDADTPGLDTAEFVELYDGGDGYTALDGLVLVLFNGANDLSYRRLDLSGYTTGEEGYFVVGSEGVPGVNLIIPGGILQNGPDAVALYEGDVVDYPVGTALTIEQLLDAVVYHTNDVEDPELAVLLHESEPQLNEGRWRNSTLDSNQRCPNGQGGQRRTSGYVQNQPSPGATNNCIVDQPPSILELLPVDGALDVPLDSAISVHFDEPVQLAEGWIRVTCLEQGVRDLTTLGGPEKFMVQSATTFLPLDSCTATIFGDRVLDLDGYQDALGTDHVWQFVTGRPRFGVCGDETTPIHALQGEGEASPLLGAVGIVVEGIVTGEFQDTDALGGFFLQEELAQQDDDPGTSEGIFVHTEPEKLDVSPGEIIRLQGDVVELDGMTSLTDVTGWLSCGVESEPEAAAINLPVAEDYNWEALEGMSVIFPQTLFVVGSNRWGSEGLVDLASERLYYPTEIVQPGTAAQQLAAENQRKRITLDDGRHALYPLPTPPYLGPDNTLRLGDTAEGITGILTDSVDGYRLQPVQSPYIIRANSRPNLPAPIPGRTRLATINTGGYFNGDGSGGGFEPGYGAQTAEEYVRQRRKLVTAILALDADIIALTAVENDGDFPESALPDLVQMLNDASASAQVYQAITVPGGQMASFANTVALLYRPDRVSLQGDPLTASGYPFDSLVTRPLGQQFVAVQSGETFTVIVAQFPERGDCPQGPDPNNDQGDGQACWNRLRSEAATTLADWVAQLRVQSGTELILTGDFNSYRLEDPLRILEETGLASTAFGGEDAQAYSAVFNGESGSLIHSLVSDGLTERLALAQAWHINADEPAALDYRISNQPALYTEEAFRSAAQDPFVLDLAATALDAGFTSNSPVFIGQAMEFSDATLGPQLLSYTWEFGDGSAVSSEQNPQHVYTAVGIYTVTLTVSTSWGETAEYRAEVQVLPARAYIPIYPTP